MIKIGEIKPDMSKTSKLPMTDTLFVLAESDIQSGLNLLPSQLAYRIDQRLIPEQKLWSQELLQTAALIDSIYGSWGYGFNFDIMILELRNNLGWRVVSPVACQLGQTIDPITRKCVLSQVINSGSEQYSGSEADTKDNVIYTTKGDVIDTKTDNVIDDKASPLSGNTLTYLLIVGVGLILLMGRK